MTCADIPHLVVWLEGFQWEEGVGGIQFEVKIGNRTMMGAIASDETQAGIDTIAL